MEQIDEDFRENKRFKVDDKENRKSFGNVAQGENNEHRQPTSEENSFDSEGGITVCMLSDTRNVRVRQFNRSVLVDIREFYTKNGQSLPSRKGISLTVDQLQRLFDHRKEIEQAVEEIQTQRWNRQDNQFKQTSFSQSFNHQNRRL